MNPTDTIKSVLVALAVCIFSALMILSLTAAGGRDYSSGLTMRTEDIFTSSKIETTMADTSAWFHSQGLQYQTFYARADTIDSGTVSIHFLIELSTDTSASAWPFNTLAPDTVLTDFSSPSLSRTSRRWYYRVVQTPLTIWYRVIAQGGTSNDSCWVYLRSVIQ